MAKENLTLTIEQRLLNYHTRLQGVSTDLAIKLLAVMSLTDADVKDLLISELPKQKDTLKAELKRLPKIIEKITAIRKKSYDAGKDLIFDTVAKVVSKCTDVTAQAVNAEIAKARRHARERQFCKTLTPEQQQAIIQGQGVDGATIAKWFEKFQLADLERIASFCQRASVEAMSVADITRAVRGTKAKNYTDGLLATTQSSAVMLARTLINGVSNNTRAETIKANADVIDGIKFLATLDGKTCKLCAPYDGYIWRGNDMSQARRPPIHPNCRCTLIPYVELKDQDGNPIDLEG